MPLSAAGRQAGHADAGPLHSVVSGAKHVRGTGDAAMTPPGWQSYSADVKRFARAVALASAVLLVTMLAGSKLFAGRWSAFDEAMLLFFRVSGDPATPIGSRFVNIAVRDITALGGVVPLVLLVAFVAIYLLLQGHIRTAIGVVASSLAGVIVSETLKVMIGRARPEIVPHLVPEVSGSFPSGHAMMSAVIYMTLGSMLVRLEPHARVRYFLLGASVGLPALIGISRVYLGVHWPSDVVGGWLIGALWILVAAHVLDRVVEGEGGAGS